ncbi:MAG: MFS transporter [Gemmatimonadaceae bacterium]
MTPPAAVEARVSTEPEGLFGWWKAGSSEAHKALIAGGMGWALDAFDVMLFALTLPAIMSDLHLTKAQGGALGSITLLGAAVGGIFFGYVADRFGRTRALMASVLLYSIFTAACGFSQSLTQLAILRALLGLGMGGEWASGAALVSETWPAKARGRALAFMQGSWAIGFAAAAMVVGFVLPRYGWRAVFFIGVLPALLTLWVRRNVREPAIWLERQKTHANVPRESNERFSSIFKGKLLPLTVAVTLMNACVLFGWWGLNGWMPSYLSLPVSQGGVGLTASTMSWFVVFMQLGMWLGYISFGYISDAVGRKRTYIIYLVVASALLPLYGWLRHPTLLLLLGPFVAFFGTGCFSGFGALTAELFPTPIRAWGQGFSYNLGRVASAAAPFTIGTLAASNGFFVAFAIAGAAYLLAAGTWMFIPETQGRALT